MQHKRTAFTLSTSSLANVNWLLGARNQVRVRLLGSRSPSAITLGDRQISGEGTVGCMFGGKRWVGLGRPVAITTTELGFWGSGGRG